MAIIENEKFSIPLYHGTTSIFINSIQEYGLGSIDPLEKIGAKSLMKDILELAEKQRWSDDAWLKQRMLLVPLVTQERNQNYNFQHGGAYLTYSQDLAKKYAIENPFGCEYLQYLRMFIQLLMQRDVHEVTDYFKHPVFEYWQKPSDTYIITLDQIKLSDIEPELNVDLGRQIEDIESKINQGQHDAQSFRLINPISPENLIISKLGSWKPDGTYIIEATL
jgi:hypothetical protein